MKTYKERLDEARKRVATHMVDSIPLTTFDGGVVFDLDNDIVNLREPKSNVIFNKDGSAEFCTE